MTITKPTHGATGWDTATDAVIDAINHLPWVDIRDFGAHVDGFTDDITAVRNAIASFATSGTSDPGTGGVVFFPAGYTMISGTIDLPSNVHLVGAGMSASVIQLIPGSNCHIITTHRSTGSGNSNAFWSSVSNLMLDGRVNNQGVRLTDVTMRPGYTTLTRASGNFAANGTVVTGVGIPSGTTIVSGGGTGTAVISQAPTISALQQAPGSGSVYQGGTTDLSGNPIPWAAIYHETNPYNTQQSGDTQFDPTHRFENLRLYFINGDGIRIHGRSDVMITNVKVSFASNNGFTIDFDTSVTNCITERCLANGLEIPGHSSCRVNGNKFYNSWGAGIYVHGGTGGEIVLAGNDLQQNNWDGLRIESQTGVYFSGVISQSGYSNTWDNNLGVATWQASHTYGDFRTGPTPNMVTPTTPNGHVYAAYIEGTSGGSEPTWPTTNGNTVVDGSVTWVCMANAPAAVSMLDATDCIIDAVTQLDLNGLRITGTSTENAVRMSHTRAVTGSVDVSSDSISLGASGNDVTMNGASLTGGGGGGGGGTAVAAVARLTSGPLSLANTSWTDVNTALDLVLTAATGDWVEVNLGALVYAEEANGLYFDACTVVSGSPVNWLSSGTSASGSHFGEPSWSMPSNYKGSIGGAVLYQLQSGDIVSGQTRIRLRYYTTGSSPTRSVDASAHSSGFPLIVSGKIVH